MARLPGLRPPGARVGYGGLSTGRPALTTNWLASMQATLRAFPPPTRRAIGDPERKEHQPEQSQEQLAKCNRRSARAAQALLEPCAFDLRGPCAAVRVGRSGPVGGIGMDVDAFSSGQDALSKSPADPHGLAERKLGKRQAGCPSLWLLSLGQARESNPASGRRAEARCRRARSRTRYIRTKSLERRANAQCGR